MRPCALALRTAGHIRVTLHLACNGCTCNCCTRNKPTSLSKVTLAVLYSVFPAANCNQQTIHPINRSINQAINHPSNQPTNQAINQPSNQPTNQSINQSASCYYRSEDRKKPRHRGHTPYSRLHTPRHPFTHSRTSSLSLSHMAQPALAEQTLNETSNTRVSGSPAIWR